MNKDSFNTFNFVNTFEIYNSKVIRLLKFKAMTYVIVIIICGVHKYFTIFQTRNGMKTILYNSNLKLS